MNNILHIIKVFYYEIIVGKFVDNFYGNIFL